MDKLVTTRLELTEFWFAVAAARACKNAGFPYGCYLVGIRDIDGESE